MTIRAKRYQNFAALLILMRRTTPFEPFEPIEPVEPLLQTIKGQHAHGLTPEPIISKIDKFI